MGLLDILGVDNPVTQIIKAVVDRIPDPHAREMATIAAEQAAASGDLQLLQAQIEVNKIEAAHESVFVSGWRAGLAWLCTGVLGLVALCYLVWPVVAHAFGLPYLADPNESLVGFFVTTVLGLAGLRTADRWRGVAKGQSPASRAAAVAKK